MARVSLVQGNVSTMNGDAGQWVATTVNAPIQRGDKISTGDRSRSEIQLDYANVLRLDQQSQANVADLTRSRIQLQLSQGNANYDVLEGSEAEAEIDTPNVAVHPNQAGSYRIQVDPNSGETMVTVRKGQAEVSTPQGSTTVEEGQMITIRGTDNPQYQVNDAPARDEWDEWNQNRDNQILQAQSWKHTDKYYTGTQDLDQYGHWHNDPGYGDVWSPDAGPDWAPYQDGRWVWEPYYGWTWVSDEPWGWAPYHYGRWFYNDDAWDWWPGPIYAGYDPLWAPAYVSFFGFGGGFGFGFGFGSIGWCPIGPFDSYYPWYGRGFHNTYNSVNITNITNINNFRGRAIVRPMPPLATGGRYPRMSNIPGTNKNPGALRGFTTVSAHDFGNGRVPRNASHISASQLRQAQRIRGGVPVAPTRQSFSPTGRTVSRPATAARNQTFFSRNQSTAGNQRLSNRGPSMATSQFANRPGSAASSRSGWQRFGSASTPRAIGNQGFQGRRAGATQISGASRQSIASARPAPSNGWQRFNQHSTAIQRGPSNYPARQPSQPAPSNGSQRFNQRTTPIQRGPSNYPARQPWVPAPSNGWQRFNQPSTPIQRGPSNYPARQPAQPAPSGWNRFNGRTMNAPAPRSNYRPPVGMNKPIVTQRAPRGYYGGGHSVAPSGGYYGGGRSVAPSGGYYGGGRSVAPSGGYYGGGRSVAPSRGYYGGSRSAPSGGYSGGGYRGGGGGYRSGGGGYRGGGGGGSYHGGGGGSRGGSSGGHSKH
ncbi:MAG TPA: DUF6600 domain-containing protein [Terriglobia bacterium]|nr:DUF6600 domain-containing protein [Terriglobia bacterium]